MGNGISFNKIFEETMRNEGGYVNDPSDKGGETFMGISRKYHKDWAGWQIIDAYKNHPAFPDTLETDNELRELVKQFYKLNFWVNPKFNLLPPLISVKVFDIGVNVGVKRASKMLQEALNLLNRNGKLFDNLVVDGIIGDKTIQAVRKVDSVLLRKVINGLQFNHYYKIMLKDPTQRRFVGWFSRLD